MCGFYVGRSIKKPRRRRPRCKKSASSQTPSTIWPYIWNDRMLKFVSLTEPLPILVKSPTISCEYLYNDLFFTDSRSWLNKIKILPDRKDHSDDEPPPLRLNKLPPVSNSQSTPTPYNVSGNYDPRDGIVHSGLNLVENEVFYRDSSDEQRRPSAGLVQEALIFLNLDVYQ